MHWHQELLDAALHKDDTEQAPEHAAGRSDIEAKAPAKLCAAGLSAWNALQA